MPGNDKYDDFIGEFSKAGDLVPPIAVSNRSSILFTGMHDAYSVGAHTFSLSLCMNLIYRFHAGDDEVINFMLSQSIWVVPSLNVDGYKYIMESDDIRLV